MLHHLKALISMNFLDNDQTLYVVYAYHSHDRLRYVTQNTQKERQTKNAYIYSVVANCWKMLYNH